MPLVYDNRFDSALLVDFEYDDCARERLKDVSGEDPSEYLTYEDLQEHFSLSRHHIAGCLTKLGIKPIGELRNYDDGRRARGVGKHVFASSVLDDIETLTSSAIDIEDIKRRALLMIEEG